MFLSIFFETTLLTNFVLELISNNFTAYCLGKLCTEFDDSRVLVRSSTELDIGLNFLFKLFARLGSRNENDTRLDYLASYLVGRGANTAFEDVRKLHNRRFYFKRPDTVSRRFDDVVGTSYIPVVAVLVSPSKVARVVHSIVPNAVGCFLVEVVSKE